MNTTITSIEGLLARTGFLPSITADQYWVEAQGVWWMPAKNPANMVTAEILDPEAEVALHLMTRCGVLVSTARFGVDVFGRTALAAAAKAWGLS